MSDFKISVLLIFFCFCVHNSFSNSLMLNVKDFGARGNNISNDTKAIQSALDYAHKSGGGEVLIPTSSGSYLISETLYIGSNTKLSFQESFIKLIHYTKRGTMIQNRDNATNIEIFNPRLDGNFIFAGGTGENGISFGNGGTIKVNGGIIKNLRKGNTAYKLGGKGIQVENKNVKLFSLSGTKIINCSIAISSQFEILENQRSNTSINVKLENVYAENCGIFVLLVQVNGVKELSNRHNFTITNFTAKNCGQLDGVFVFSRAKSFNILNGKIIGSSTAKSIIRGRHSEGVFNNIDVYQNSESIINLEPSFHGIATSKSENNIYTIKLYSNTNHILTTSPNYKNKFRELFSSDLKIDNEGLIKSSPIIPQAISSTSKVELRSLKSRKSLQGNMLELYNKGQLKSL